MRIGIDVDLVTLQSDVAWWNWLHYMCPTRDVSRDIFEEIDKKKILIYDLSAYFPPPVNHNVDAKDFWRNEGVYDTIDPVPGAVQAINRLIDDGNRIIFITHSKGNGNRSKFNNLVRHFGRRFEFIVTKEKYLVNVDVHVDDRRSVLSNFDDDTKLIQMDTPYIQSEVNDGRIIKVSNWQEAYEEIYRNQM